MTACAVPGCPLEGLTRRHGWCYAHYRRWVRFGDPVASVTRGPQRQPRLPMQPLLDTLGPTTVERAAELLGLDRRYFYRLCRSGLTPTMADQLAVKKVHRHPGEVWGDAWWDLDKEYAEAEELEGVA